MYLGWLKHLPRLSHFESQVSVQESPHFTHENSPGHKWWFPLFIFHRNYNTSVFLFPISYNTVVERSIWGTQSLVEELDVWTRINLVIERKFTVCSTPLGARLCLQFADPNKAEFLTEPANPSPIEVWVAWSNIWVQTRISAQF